MAAVASDGVSCKVKSPATRAVATTQEESEQWFFDTHGYLIIPDVMDAAWLRVVNEATDLQLQTKDNIMHFNRGQLHARARTHTHTHVE